MNDRGEIMTCATRGGISAWLRESAQVAREILDACGMGTPPVDAWVVARTLGLRVAFDAFQQGRGRLKRIGGRRAVLMRPKQRPEREQWTLAHEIGEALAVQVYSRVDVDPHDVPPQRREQVANALASNLLLPDGWFLRDARTCDGDVLRLKAIYSTAGHELILFNLLKLPELSLASVFDQRRLTRRRGNGQLSPPPLLPLERRVWGIVRESREPAQGASAGVRVQGWPVSEPGGNRELLRTTAVEGLEGMQTADDDAYSVELAFAE
jgi:Zn-dependent peptidase ImmA (M78 family)